MVSLYYRTDSGCLPSVLRQLYRSRRAEYGLSEVNHVAYDPEEVAVEQLIVWLKESGTYIRTISDTAKDETSNVIRN